MKAVTLPLAAALLATSGAAHAQSASDIQCLVVSNAFAKESKTADQKKAAESSIYFYLGRIGDGMTPAQLKTLLYEQTKALTDKTAGPAMDKCVDAIQSKIKMVQSLAAPPAAAAEKPQGR